MTRAVIHELVCRGNHNIGADNRSNSKMFRAMIDSGIQPDGMLNAIQCGAVNRIFVILVNVLVSGFQFDAFGDLAVELDRSTIAKNVLILAR